MLPIALGTTLVGPNKETFKITGFVGRGGFGEVYRAVGQTTGIVVAVKLLPLGEMASAESQQALLNEVGASQQVKHANVVEIFHVNDGGSSQIGPYVIMEYVPDGALANLLESQSKSGTQIPLARTIEMMIDIAQGASAINAKVIHRDIKPDNILIKGSTLKIGDFGISKLADESTRLHTFKGVQAMAYKAPESWRYQTNTFKIDVYSVGLVFYEILTLKHPLQGKVRDVSDFHDWENAHLFEQCPDVRNLRSDVPLSVAQLLTRMVTKKAEDRPAWEEVLKILRQPEAAAATPKSAAVSAAVQAVFARHQKLQKDELRSKAQQEERQREVDLYSHSCLHDMLRFALNRLASQLRIEREAWVYLEAFLLHYRNLIEFFGNPHPRKTDLTIQRTEDFWKERPKDADIAKMTRPDLWEKYDTNDNPGAVSKYLQHCTQQRVIKKNWRVVDMYEELRPAIETFESLLPNYRPVKPRVSVFEALQQDGNSTTSTRVLSPASLLDNNDPGTKRRS